MKGYLLRSALYVRFDGGGPYELDTDGYSPFGASYCTSIYTKTMQGGGSRLNGSLSGWNPCDVFCGLTPIPVSCMRQYLR